MRGVRILAGTRKGAFILESDEKRQKWTVSEPLFGGWEIYHVKGSPLDPDLLFASQSSGWFGQVIQRSHDGGRTWETAGNKFVYEGGPVTHQWYDGSQRAWEFKRVWYLQPSEADVQTVYAGVEDAALFRSTDCGDTWQEMAALREVQGNLWQPGGGGMCLHTILLDPDDPGKIYTAISAAGAFRSDDGGASWKAINKGLRSEAELPEADVEVGHCVHSLARHPARPDVLFMQKHWDVMRSNDGGLTWAEVSGNLPSDFGFPIAVHPQEPDTIYVIPIKSDTEHYPPEGKLRVYRSRTGGNDWEALTRGLPQQNCFVNVFRSALAVDTLDESGIYFGTTGGQIYGSTDGGDSWQAVVRDLPAVLSVEVQTLK